MVGSLHGWVCPQLGKLGVEYQVRKECINPQQRASTPALHTHKDIRLEIANPQRLLPQPLQLLVPLLEPFNNDVIHRFLARRLLARRVGVVAHALLRRRHDAGEPLLQPAPVHVVL